MRVRIQTEAKGKPNYNACSNALQKDWLSSSASVCRLHSFTTLEDWRLRSCKWNQNAVLLDQNALYFWLVQWVDNTINGINLYPVDSTMNDFPVIAYPCFAHRLLGSPGGKHCESLQRIVWRGVVSPLKAVSLDIECRTLPWFYEKRRWLMLVRWNFKFLCD